MEWMQREREGASVMTLTVRDVMTSTVVALRETASYKEIIRALRRHRVSASYRIYTWDTAAGRVTVALEPAAAT
jgi:CBS-domain-containing membrane protein